MLDKWRRMLTGGGELDGRDLDIAACIDKITGKAEKYWKAMQQPMGSVKNRAYLWDDLQGSTDSQQLTIAYSRIRGMALAYAVKGSRLEGDETLRADIIFALDWMNEYRYGEGMTTYSNWWHWEIGTPHALNDAVVLMYGDLTRDRIEAYMRAVDYFSPDLTTFDYTGANRIWICVVQAVRSVILRDGRRLSEVRDAVGPVFPYVREGDGFYRDGSFIQHDMFAYTGGYGVAVLSDLAKLLALLGGTEWEVADPGVRHVYEWVFHAFTPIIYNGLLMDMTRGREISRCYFQDHDAGHRAIDAILHLSAAAPASEAVRMQRLVKHWILADTHRSYLEQTPLELIVPAKKLLGNPDVVPDSDRCLTKIYGCMDRVVHHREGYAFGISMFSDRVRNYESINSENLRGWYTAHGLTYLYNADLGQFSDAFWPTVDARRLPGTTVTKSPMADSFGWNSASSKSWVGGAILHGKYGVAGMELEDYRFDDCTEPLTALKSWFLFDEEIVALGSGIHADSDYLVETIVENRKLNERGDNAFTVDGILQPGEAGWSSEWKSASWIHLQGDAPGSDIGFYFPDAPTVKACRETRNGTWFDISKLEGNYENLLLTRSYLSVWFDHGLKPQEEAYAYALLPGASVGRTKAYANEPSFEVIERSREAHAVYHKGLRLTAVNFWCDGPKTVDPVTSQHKAALMIMETDDGLEVSLSDPTHRNEAAIEIEIARSAKAVVAADESVSVQRLAPTIRLSVRVKDAMGETFRVIFAK